MFKHPSTLVLAFAALALTSSGCAMSSESAGADDLTRHVGNYSPPPSGVERIRVGVPAFKVTDASLRGAKVESLAADQLTTLAFKTERFDVIERTQLNQMLEEQNLQGIVRDGELASQGEVRGVDYLFIGKVTNLRVKKEKANRGFGLAKVTKLVGGVDVETDSVKIKVECGVDLRLVDPSSGEIIATEFGEYTRTDEIKAFGLEILGANAKAGADLDIPEDDKGKILRLALDDTIRKMLPTVDKFLKKNRATSDGGTNDATSGKQFCTGCGSAMGAEAKFCGSCGAKAGS